MHAPEVLARARGLAVPIALAAMVGCGSLPPASDSDALRQSVIESVRKQLEEQTPPDPELDVQPQRPDPQTTLGLSAERVERLREISGPESYAGLEADPGPSLYQETSPTRPIGLGEAMRLALTGDNTARSARLAPPITRAELIQAEAAFDWTLFANVERTVTDAEQPVPVVGMTPVGTGLSRQDAIRSDTGVRKLLTTNGTLELSANLDVENNATPNFSRNPDPAYSASLDVVFNQPLLRGFGAEVALADVDLASNANQDAIEFTRDSLINTLTEVERAYWTLFQTRERLLIQERLLQRGIETREALRGRYGFDVTDAELADAAARVESRRGDLIRAQSAFRDASDRLKRLINDPGRPLIDETVLIAADAPVDIQTTYDLREAIAGALLKRPDVRRALLRVRAEAIRERVARNFVLPRLDLTVRLSSSGLESDSGDAFGEAFETNFVNSAIGLSFEQPIGNREAEAGRRAARLRSLRSTIDYRNAVRLAIEDVKISLRTVKTNFRLIEQTRLARIAAAENLRALQVEEETIRGLTPDFLNLKLNRQEALARAELDEITALADYARSIAEAAGALGVTLEQAGVTVDPDALEERADQLLRESRQNPTLEGEWPIDR